MTVNTEKKVKCDFCGSNDRVLNTGLYSGINYDFVVIGKESYTQIKQYEFACFECRKKYRFYKSIDLMQYMLFNDKIKEGKLVEAGIIISNNLLHLGDSSVLKNKIKHAVWKKEQDFKVVGKKQSEQELKDFFVKMKEKKLPVYAFVKNKKFIGVGVGPVRRKYLKYILK